MFGLYRFILAALVLIGHVCVDWPVHLGVAAVTNFFMLSGFVMTLLLRQHYGRFGASIGYFYLDRVLRLFPQYLLYISITEFCLQFYHFRFFYDFFEGEPSVPLFLLNAALVPMNYALFFPALKAHFLIPASWSLGLEEQYYWLFPAVAFKPWASRLATVGSLAIFAAAVFGVFPQELIGYRLLPGVLFMFVLGKNLADWQTRFLKEDTWTCILVYLSCVGLWIYELATASTYSDTLLRDELAGIVIGLPVLWGLSHLERRAWDEVFGQLSYGLFLNHVLVVNLLIEWNVATDNRLQVILGGLSLASLFSFLSYLLVEKPVRSMRLRLRERIRPKDFALKVQRAG